MSSSNLKSELNLSCSTRTIRCTLKNIPHLKLKRIVSEPSLIKNHKSARLEFCRHNMQQNWNLAWYSDEKRFDLDGPDRQKYYFHDLRKYLLIASKRQQGGGGTLVWAAFSTNKKSLIELCNKNLNVKGYAEILKKYFFAILQSRLLIHKEKFHLLKGE